MESIDDRLRAASDVIIQNQQNVTDMRMMLTQTLGELPSDDMTARVLFFGRDYYQRQIVASVRLVMEQEPEIDQATAVEMAHAMALSCVFWQGCALGKQLGIGEGAEFAGQFNLTSDNDKGKDTHNE